MDPPPKLEINSDDSVHQATQGCTDQLLNEYFPYEIHELDCDPSSLLDKIKDVNLGINNKSGSNCFVDYPNESCRAMEYKESVYQVTQGYTYQPLYEYLPYEILQLDCYSSALLDKIKHVKLGINNKSGSNYFVDNSDKSYWAMEYMESVYQVTQGYMYQPLDEYLPYEILQLDCYPSALLDKIKHVKLGINNKSGSNYFVDNFDKSCWAMEYMESVYRATQGYMYQLLDEYLPYEILQLDCYPSALLDKIKHVKLGINNKSGSNYFVDNSEESCWAMEYMERFFVMTALTSIQDDALERTSDHVGVGGVSKKIGPRRLKSIKGALYHEERLRENARELYRCMSIYDQAIAQDHTTEWLFDTAASFSVTGNAANLQGIHGAPPVNATVANGQTISSHHCGRAVGDVSVSGVRYIPGAPDLISGGHLARLGCYSTTSEQGVTITKGGMVVGHGRLLENNTYTLDFLSDNYLGTICVSCPWPHGHGAQLAATSSN